MSQNKSKKLKQLTLEQTFSRNKKIEPMDSITQFNAETIFDSPEIVGLILVSCSYENLKELRLVCKIWCKLTNELFEKNAKLYIEHCKNKIYAAPIQVIARFGENEIECIIKRVKIF
jgi:hypothetical protein